MKLLLLEINHPDASSMDGYAQKIDKLPSKKLLVVGKVAQENRLKVQLKKGKQLGSLQEHQCQAEPIVFDSRGCRRAR